MRRPLSLDDVLSLRTFEGFYGSQFALDPIGERLAFSMQKGAGEAPTFGVPFLVGTERGELHLLDLRSRALRLLPAPAKHGVFSPVFSPDGSRIAVGVTDGRFAWPGVVDRLRCKLRPGGELG